MFRISNYMWLYLLLITFCLVGCVNHDEKGENKNYEYVFTFNDGKNLWETRGGASYDKFGRSGKSIKISTWTKKQERSECWSKFFKVKPGIMNIGAWAAQNLFFVQDPGFGAVLAIVCYDKDKKEINRQQLVHITKPDRKDIFHGVAIVPEGLSWEYHDKEFNVPSKSVYAQLVFTWTSFIESWRQDKLITGEVWMDDITLNEGALAKNKLVLKNTKELPYHIFINVQPPLNLFIPSDPLEFSFMVYSPDDYNKIPETKDLSIRYTVSDYEKLPVFSGTLPFSDSKAESWRKSKKEYRGLVKTVTLDKELKKSTGQWLEISAALFKGNKKIAQGNTSFAILNPPFVKNAKPEQDRFLRGNAQKRVRNWRDWKQFIPQYLTSPWSDPSHPTCDDIIGKYGLVFLGVDGAWRFRQKTRNSAIDFSKDIDKLVWSGVFKKEVKYKDRVPGYIYTVYTIPNEPPKWAIVKKYPDGGIKLDAQAYAKYFEEYVRHTPVTHYIVTCTEGADGALNHAEMVAAAAKAVKKVDPRLKVGVCTELLFGGGEVAGKISKEVLENVDFFVNDYYNTPVNVMPFKNKLRKRGYEKEIWICETGNLSLKDQRSRAESAVKQISYAFANGADKLLWWSFPGSIYFMTQKSKEYKFGPDLRAPYSLKLDVSFYAGWRNNSPDYKLFPIKGMRARPPWQPFLECITLHHVYRHLAHAKNGKPVSIAKDCDSFLFENDLFPGDKKTSSVMVSWSRTGTGSKHYLLKNPLPYETTDMYGRIKKFKPQNNVSLLTIGETPLMIHFGGLVKNVKTEAAPLEINMNRNVSANNNEKLTVKLRNPFGKPFKGKLRVYGPNWNIVPSSQNISLAKGESGTYIFNIKIPSDASSGLQPLFLSFSTLNGDVWGEIRENIYVQYPVSMTVTSVPASPGGKAQLEIKAHNNSNSEKAGNITFDNPFTPDLRPQKISADFKIPPKGAWTFKQTLAKEPEKNKAHTLDITMNVPGMEPVRKTNELFSSVFRKEKTPLKWTATLMTGI